MMKPAALFLLIGATLPASQLLAGQGSDASLPPPIERIYVSPGASGSISQSRRYEQQDLYGGQPVTLPAQRFDSGSSSSSTTTRGGLRQSIEYPDGRQIELTPGQSDSTRQIVR